MTDRELATVLAALRMWQKQLVWNEMLIPEELQEIAADAGERLSPFEIDGLCEKLNILPLEWTKEETQEREA